MTKEAIKEQLDAANGRILVVYTAEGDGVRLLDVALVVEIETSAAA